MPDEIVLVAVTCVPWQMAISAAPNQQQFRGWSLVLDRVVLQFFGSLPRHGDVEELHEDWGEDSEWGYQVRLQLLAFKKSNR
jgi:hypothetical protein